MSKFILLNLIFNNPGALRFIQQTMASTVSAL